MNPAEKRRNDRIVSIISLGLLVPLVVVVGYFLVEEIKYSSQVEFVEPIVVERAEPITPEAVEQERALLPTQTVVPAEATPQSAAQVQVKMLTEADVARLLDTSNQQSIQVESVVMESFSDDVNFTSVAITSTETDDVTTQVLQGAVFEINYEEGFVTISTPDQQVTEVQISTATRIYINGRIITLQDLKVGDMVRIEGSGNRFSINAQSISVIGSMEVLFTN